MVSLQYSYVKFSRDSVHQKLLKSVNFSPSYTKYRGALIETQCSKDSAVRKAKHHIFVR